MSTTTVSATSDPPTSLVTTMNLNVTFLSLLSPRIPLLRLPFGQTMESHR